MKTLVTGGGGFLGRWIVKKLLARGNTVRVLGRSEYPDLVAEGVETVKADLTDRAAVIDACERMDAVFHVAALPGIWGKKEDFYNTNTVGTNNVIAGCRQHGVQKLIYTSTPSVVYGRKPISGGDESLPYPDNYLAHYPASKAEAEKAVLAANDPQGLLTCSLRPHLIWGPGDTNLIPRLIERSRSGKLRIVGEGLNKVSVIYVENAADAHLAACDRLTTDSPVAGSAYFIVEPEPVECWTFLNKLLEGLQCPPVTEGVSVSTAYTAGRIFEWIYQLFRIQSEPPMTRFLALQLGTEHWFKADKAMNELGWQPAVSIEEGMQRLFAEYGNP